jgi:hypothetical protein
MVDWSMGRRSVISAEFRECEIIYAETYTSPCHWCRLISYMLDVCRWQVLRGITSHWTWLRLALSKGPNWVGVFPPHTWGEKQIQFPKRRVFLSLEYRTMEKVQKPSNCDCDTPSSEPYRIYFYSNITKTQKTRDKPLALRFVQRYPVSHTYHDTSYAEWLIWHLLVDIRLPE